ncbi:MAG: ABC transporter substrate-binding protein [Nocardiopsaceae bacterium]|nr:ABC transporter substrate-binding protein [Nocardiopsaceae bacterium]
MRSRHWRTAMTPVRRVSRGWALCGGIGAIVAVSACTTTIGGNPSSTPGGSKVILTLAGNTGGPQPRNFNPYLPTSGINALWGAAGMIYEPLVQRNNIKPDQNYPWLAKSWEWSNGNKTLTFHLRSGVTWQDGKPFTSLDVAFTFNMLKDNPQINTGGIKFDTVSAPNPLTVVMTFSASSFTQFYQIAEAAYMVPKHIWQSVGNPATYENPKPVGTGPFKLTSFQPSAMLLTRNPDYWQHGLPKIYGLRYVQYSDSTTAEEDQEAGKIDWGGGPITNGQKLYVDKDPEHFHFWYPATGIVSILPNQSVWPLNMVAVRKAISLAVDRNQISKVGEEGYEAPVTSATGLLLPNFTDDLNPKYQDVKLEQNVAAAKKVLTDAGFKMGSNGLMAMGGREIKLTLSDPTGFNDYMTNNQIIASELKAIGIGVTVQGLSTNGWESDIATGNFQMTLMWSSSGDLYTILASLLDYRLSGPIGTSASGGNYERWNDPQTQAFLRQYETSPTEAGRKQALYGLQDIMVNKVPVIPLVGAADWGSYSTRKVTGFPSPQNPYATATAGTPNGEIVALHLVPVKS